ncbi:hypothetical protein ETAA8_29640 [Anatilimnocola aggregata]|uniref:Uncharacterized protein n=1 Tax=Anatilimnocola aggregata TaxID=2528021 RepID=A0A517YCA2_9BACT|nr:hypothetical protein [Anatilimnocola aggregata]QDU27873.1 hypothetical protein ETAA8_29640 [Anatilimnocola aggregata]
MRTGTLTMAVSLTMLLLGVRFAAANAAPIPRPQATSQKAPVVIKTADLSDQGVRAKIVIPARLKPVAEAPRIPGFGPGPRPQGSLAPTPRSIVAAIALSLAAVSVVFVLRGKHVLRTTKAVVLGAAGLLAVLGVAQADIKVPGQPYRGPARPPGDDKPQIMIEYSDEAEEVTLTLSSGK